MPPKAATEVEKPKPKKPVKMSGGQAMAAVLKGLEARDAKKRPAAAGTPATGSKKVKNDGPSFGPEASRQQWLCRSGGSGKGSTYAVKWAAHGGKEAAEIVAKKWVDDKIKELASA